MTEDKKSGYRTLLTSMLLSSPGPLVLGLGLTVGHSSTQLSDFTRRTAEFLALIVAFAVYTVTNKQPMDRNRKLSLERKGNCFVGMIMCASGLSMTLLTILSGRADKGNVIPALVIAFLGAVTNIIFWRRYTFLHKKQENSILGVQARLYEAKSGVDLCVTLTLVVILMFPGSRASSYLDVVGSLLVSLYMLRGGIKTILEQRS
ncbi:cation transporter [Propionibacterium australiense]|uniref:Cation efflux family n=1 Tax=Propionibacterium australiense TaxID=119981 RepID=A0A383S686_9ACTN|nr:cation transporter [Propionibacterium australiense]RLP10680.1 transporter [Propionibacterium australiense]RLP12975.1 transporter [Propionibacterium australiense]SYZ32889.1 Cation efflux family [Propionibacterium australiense]VEH91055.1 Predicted Co/Zn/Cd cation transporters [Propionibacterium australiense]